VTDVGVFLPIVLQYLQEISKGDISNK
jgi:hypothetical protein